MNPDYKLYHPKWHRTRMPIFWWLRRLSYTVFIGRELTSVFVGYSAVLLLFQARAIGQGEAAYDRFLSWLQLPAVVALHVIVLLIVLLHTVSWLSLAPQALVLRLRGRRVPDAVVLAAHYASWLVASALVAWVLLGTW